MDDVYYIRAFAQIIPAGNHTDLAVIRTNTFLVNALLHAAMVSIAAAYGVPLSKWNDKVNEWESWHFQYKEGHIWFDVSVIRKENHTWR